MELNWFTEQFIMKITSPAGSVNDPSVVLLCSSLLKYFSWGKNFGFTKYVLVWVCYCNKVLCISSNLHNAYQGYQ